MLARTLRPPSRIVNDPLRPTEFTRCPLCGADLAQRAVQGRVRLACPACAFVAYENPASASAGVVLDGEGRVLLVRRLLEPFRGAWALPAGYQDHDEDSRSACIREVREETGLEVETLAFFDLVWVADDFRRAANVAVYFCRVTGGKLRIGDEESDVRWFGLDELPAEIGFRNRELILDRIADHPTYRSWLDSHRARQGAGSEGVSYKDAGVDIDAAQEALRRAKRSIQRTFTAGVKSDIGLFGGLFDLDAVGASGELLVASADGVGSKLEIAKRAGIYDTVGRDLVQHCINDILVQGARPHFFMDYVGVGRLDPTVVSALIEGCAAACADHGLALLGGETAEMPGLYAPGDFDLVGFVVGTVARERVLDGSRVAPGQVLIALPSEGLHTNGYSLARKVVFDVLGLDVGDRPAELEGQSIADALLAPHRCYFELLWPLLEQSRIAALAHITGGGLVDNLPRVLGSCDAIVDPTTWTVPALFRWLCEAGRVPEADRWRTFNMGVGMVAIVAADQVDGLRDELARRAEPHWVLGHTVAGEGRVRFQPGAVS